MSNLTISAKTKSSIFKILGTAQFGVEVDAESRDQEVSFYLYSSKSCKRETYIKGFNFYTFRLDTFKALEGEFLKEVRTHKEYLLEKMEEVKDKLRAKQEKETTLQKLSSNYDSLLSAYDWFYTYDMGFTVLEKDVLENEYVYGFKKNEETSFSGLERHSFILEISGAELIRYDCVENCYFTTVPSDYDVKIEAHNWFTHGFQDGYADNFCATVDTKVTPNPTFPNTECKRVYERGYGEGAYQGGMDT